MKKFLGKEGITAASANHVANIAKEYYEELQDRIEKVHFTKTMVYTSKNPDSKLLKRGSSTVSMENIKEIMDARGLVAYLREAIKEKARLSDEAQNKIYVEFTEKPKMPAEITEYAVMQEWSAEKLRKYYLLDAKCATLGKYIHPSGALNKERKRLNSLDPISYRDLSDTVVFEEEIVAINPEILDNIFFSLQKEYREYQAELNGLKHELEIEVRIRNRSIQDSYDLEYSSYRSIHEQELIQNSKLRENTLAEIENLKIVIPDSLKDIYHKITHLA